MHLVSSTCTETVTISVSMKYTIASAMKLREGMHRQIKIIIADPPTNITVCTVRKSSLGKAEAHMSSGLLGQRWDTLAFSWYPNSDREAMESRIKLAKRLDTFTLNFRLSFLFAPK